MGTGALNHKPFLLTLFLKQEISTPFWLLHAGPQLPTAGGTGAADIRKSCQVGAKVSGSGEERNGHGVGSQEFNNSTSHSHLRAPKATRKILEVQFLPCKRTQHYKTGEFQK